jgi:molecular chaperone DnaK (HSP70)
LEGRISGEDGVSSLRPRSMAPPRFSIGIDLGTTNCAMAFEALDTATPQSELFLIPQWENLAGFSEASTLPSFLYLLSEGEILPLAGQPAPRTEWIAGRLARKRAAESPGRVVHSAKSWLCHHAVDRNAPFLPWRSDEIPVEKRISPIQASALLLGHLRSAWNTRFVAEGLQFEEQEITITVPASFDAVAQRLTLDAAREAGFPQDVRLLEEPQAAFYRWLEDGDAEVDRWKQRSVNATCHVLVIDVGGGTTDFTLLR